MSKIVFSGIQPSGNLHIGNYIGAIKNWVDDQKTGELHIHCIVDLHAITVPQEPKILRENILNVAAMLLAAGIDPDKTLLFVQSMNPDHANLGWVFNCLVSMGQLQRMTQFKEKSDGKDSVSVGLFDYPALMAADMLIYNANCIPVGEDQKQHIELTRDIAERFNSKFGQTFVLPEAVIPKSGGRIMSLSDPTKKMSKSDINPKSRIELLDSEEDIRSKIASAVTDSQSSIRYSKDRPGLANLIEIYSQFSNKSTGDIESEFENKGYKEFKEAVAQSIIDVLKPIQAKYRKLRDSKELVEILQSSAQKASKLSHPKLLEVYEKVGFITKSQATLIKN